MLGRDIPCWSISRLKEHKSGKYQEFHVMFSGKYWSPTWVDEETLGRSSILFQVRGRFLFVSVGRRCSCIFEKRYVGHWKYEQRTLEISEPKCRNPDFRKKLESPKVASPFRSIIDDLLSNNTEFYITWRSGKAWRSSQQKDKRLLRLSSKTILVGARLQNSQIPENYEYWRFEEFGPVKHLSAK